MVYKIVEGTFEGLSHEGRVDQADELVYCIQLIDAPLLFHVPVV